MRSERADIRRLRALRPLRDLELDALVLLERTVAVRHDRREVHEDIGATAVLGNETKALLGVEPLDAALSHLFFSLGKRYSPLFADHRLLWRPLFHSGQGPEQRKTPAITSR